MTPPRYSLGSFRERAFKSVIAFAVAVLLALGIAACGGEDDSTTTAASTPADSAAPDRDSGSQGTGGSRGQGDEAGKPASGGGGSSGSDVDAPPLKVSGGGSAQFRTKGGDNSIQEYGEESDESELQTAAEVVHDFYVARAEEDWARACTYLAKSLVEQLEALAAQSPALKDKGCPPVLDAFTRQLPASVRREITVVDAASLRHDGERGFLIYYDVENKPYAIPLQDEDGAWKLTLLSATPIS